MSRIPLIDHPALDMPALGYGTFEIEPDTVLRMIPEILDMGYRHIDTAQAYDNEAQVGQAIESAGVPRDEVFLTTKIWVDRFRPADLRASLTESLDKLRTDHVDLLLLHWPVFEDAKMEATLEALKREKDEGRTRHIGVSNFTVDHLKRSVEFLGDGEVATNQVEYHPFLGQDSLREAMNEMGIALTAYMPLAKGQVVESDVLAEIGKRYGKSAVQVALRWLVRQEGVAAIPATTDVEHARDNADIFDFRLDDEDLERIAALDKDRRICTPGSLSPDWDD